MQFPQSLSRTQLPLFEGILASNTAPLLEEESPGSPWPDRPEAFSELSLRGATGHCRNLLAPVLRELSQKDSTRWLTLIAPPASLTQAWLRDAGLNRERILVLSPRQGQSPLQLAREALSLGLSHTVVSWLQPLEWRARQQLEQAALRGRAQSLNINLG